MHHVVRARREFHRAVDVEHTHPVARIHAAIPAPQIGVAPKLLLRAKSSCREQNRERGEESHSIHHLSGVVEAKPVLITTLPLKVLAVTLALPSPIVKSMRPSLRLLPGGIVIGTSVSTSPLNVSTLNWAPDPRGMLSLIGPE